MSVKIPVKIPTTIDCSDAELDTSVSGRITDWEVTELGELKVTFSAPADTLVEFIGKLQEYERGRTSSALPYAFPERRTVQVDLVDLLDLTTAADLYGYDKSILMSSIGDWIGELTDEDIQTFANSYLTPEAAAQGYGDEDAASAVEKLEAFRERYCK